MSKQVEFGTLSIGDTFTHVTRDGLCLFHVKQDGGRNAEGKRCGIGNAFNETCNQSHYFAPATLVTIEEAI